jgi:hypothetical protein
VSQVTPAAEFVRNTVKMVEQAGRQVLACTCDVASAEVVKALATGVAKPLDYHCPMR